MDYFATGLLGLSSSSRAIHQPSASFLGQIQLGNPLHQSLTSVSSPLFTITADHHHHHSSHTNLPHFSFVPDHLVPVVTAAGGNGNSQSNHTGNGNGSNSDYNLNFTISSPSSSGLAGFNRGTLQSNSSSPPSLLPHVQRFSPIDGPSSAFFSSTTASPPNAAVAPVENHHHHHHHFLPGFDARLQLCYGDGTRHSDHKSKGKNWVIVPPSILVTEDGIHLQAQTKACFLPRPFIIDCYDSEVYIPHYQLSNYWANTQIFWYVGALLPGSMCLMSWNVVLEVVSLKNMLGLLVLRRNCSYCGLQWPTFWIKQINRSWISCSSSSKHQLSFQQRDAAPLLNC